MPERGTELAVFRNRTRSISRSKRALCATNTAPSSSPSMFPGSLIKVLQSQAGESPDRLCNCRLYMRTDSVMSPRSGDRAGGLTRPAGLETARPPRVARPSGDRRSTCGRKLVAAPRTAPLAGRKRCRRRRFRGRATLCAPPRTAASSSCSRENSTSRTKSTRPSSVRLPPGLSIDAFQIRRVVSCALSEGAQAPLGTRIGEAWVRCGSCRARSRSSGFGAGSSAGARFTGFLRARRMFLLPAG
jgi:hypothetical protein